MAKNGIDPYKNPHSKRRQRKRAQLRAEQACKLDLSTKVRDKSDWFLAMEHETQVTRTESTKVKMFKKLKPGGTARGKQKNQRASKPLI